MLRYFKSCSLFFHKEMRSTVLKVAVFLCLGFLLPIALVCEEIRRRYKINQNKSLLYSRSNRLLRRLYIFVKFSGLSEFSDFLLSAHCRGTILKVYDKQNQSTPLLNVPEVDLSRFRSGHNAHLGGLSFEGQGAFPA